MLTFDYLNVLPNNILDLYEQYQQSVINDIARRLVGLDMTSSAVWQMQRLTESGMVYEEALKKVARLTGKTEQELTKLFQQAGLKSMRFDDAIYKAVGMEPLPLNLSPAMRDVLRAGLQRTSGMLRNLTSTTAIFAQKSFLDAADMAYMQVSTGAFSYGAAIKQAVKEVAKNGLSFVEYPTGHKDQIDVAVRRAVLTGVAKTAADLQLARAAEMGTDLIEVSAHIGARNQGVGPMNHESWQGKVYSLTGTDYPDFFAVTGYGTGEGLHGWNCRHSFYPFFGELSKRAYDDETLKSYAAETVTYKGKELSFYEATQEQRKIERMIRKWKREAAALGAAGMDNSYELKYVRKWQARMRAFTKETGLYRYYDREGGAVKKQ